MPTDNELMQIYQLETQEELDALKARQAAHQRYINGAHRSPVVQGAETQMTGDDYIRVCARNTFHFYDEDEYSFNGSDPDKPRSVQQMEQNRFLTCVAGGQQIMDLDNQLLRSNTNPLELQRWPQHNIIIAGTQLLSYGGYFGKIHVNNNPPVDATVILASDYEFERFTAEQLQNEECPFIRVFQQGETSQDFILLKDKDNNPITGVNCALYLNINAYKADVKAHFMRKAKALLAAHHQMDNPEQGIEMALTLPGMGCFANLFGDPAKNISHILTPIALEAYREAIAELDVFQKGIPEGFGKIEKIRLFRRTGGRDAAERARLAVDRSELDRIFFNGAYANGPNQDGGDHEHANAGIPVEGTSIRIAANDGFVEDPTCRDANLRLALVIAGDSRAHAGNEQNLTSQEPGVFSNIPHGRALCSFLQNPALLRHPVSFQNINTVIGREEPAYVQGLPSSSSGLTTGDYVGGGVIGLAVVAAAVLAAAAWWFVGPILAAVAVGAGALALIGGGIAGVIRWTRSGDASQARAPALVESSVSMTFQGQSVVGISASPTTSAMMVRLTEPDVSIIQGDSPQMPPSTLPIAVPTGTTESYSSVKDRDEEEVDIENDLDADLASESGDEEEMDDSLVFHIEGIKVKATASSPSSSPLPENHSEFDDEIDASAQRKSPSSQP